MDKYWSLKVFRCIIFLILSLFLLGVDTIQIARVINENVCTKWVIQPDMYIFAADQHWYHHSEAYICVKHQLDTN